MTMTAAQPVGDLLREWRQRRRLSQLDLAGEADISTTHLSFLESGRSRPSRDMVMRLAERLEVPLRERNVLLVAAGFAPQFQERKLSDPALGAQRAAVELVLKGHEPYPALAIDRHWNMVAANAAAARLMGNADASLLTAAGQCAAPQPPPRRAGRADHQPCRVARRTCWSGCAGRWT